MFRLVLTDICMPIIDGYELAAQIIAYQRGWRQSIIKSQALGRIKMKRECPVIAVTAYTHDSVRKKCLSVGMKDVLSKPV